MGRCFNIAGPCIPGLHYMLPPEARCVEMRPLIERGLYFNLHAARQTGKTTLLQTMAASLAESHAAVYCSLETLQGVDDYEKGLPAILRKLNTEIVITPGLQQFRFLEGIDLTDATNALTVALRRLAASASRPVVLLLDEVDCLSERTLICFLRQLRDGYINRGRTPFPHSVALAGMRDIRDYKARVRAGRETLGSASPFNVTAKSLTLSRFSAAEVAALYAQHAAETGQRFEPAAVIWVAEQTGGQPWLVNAIASECVDELLRRDYSKPVTTTLVAQAIENIILRRGTHLDSLLERLREPRVRRIVEPVLTGDPGDFDFTDDDFLYVRDLGLIQDAKGAVGPSNPIYAEVMLRALSYTCQRHLEDRAVTGVLGDNRLDMRKLLTEFQAFWRENSEIWRERFEYKEAAPHLVLQAFLQRVLNGGGQVRREFALGRQRMDLLIEYGDGKYPLEIKLWRGEKTLADGRRQLGEYLDRVGRTEGWLVIFDRRPERAWDERIYWREESHDGKTLHVVGC